MLLENLDFQKILFLYGKIVFLCLCDITEALKILQWKWSLSMKAYLKMEPHLRRIKKERKKRWGWKNSSIFLRKLALWNWKRVYKNWNSLHTSSSKEEKIFHCIFFPLWINLYCICLNVIILSRGFRVEGCNFSLFSK